MKESDIWLSERISTEG